MTFSSTKSSATGPSVRSPPRSLVAVGMASPFSTWTMRGTGLRNFGRHQPVAEPANVATKVRCAIYTRKSTDEGLMQDFNSLDAQRESAEAYILSQKHQGWAVVRSRYDDGGY